jgi:hypothetical protein
LYHIHSTLLPALCIVCVLIIVIWFACCYIVPFACAPTYATCNIVF